MTLSQLLTEDRIIVELRARERWAAIREMADELFIRSDMAVGVRSRLLGRLHDRENRLSTGIGHGVAIPHAQVPGLERVHAVLARSTPGLDFDAVDDEPVHLLVMFLVSDVDHQLRLETLSAIGKTLSQAEFREKLMRAGSAQEMREVLTGRPTVVPRVVR
jgi:mannitol/fructose-specific phosphotransferase system IIA component (Ntr-type)